MSKQTLAGGGRAFDLSLRTDAKAKAMQQEANLVDDFMNPAAKKAPDEKPLSLPEFDDEDDENNEDAKATFNWDGVQEVQNVTAENHVLREQVTEQKEELEE